MVRRWLLISSIRAALISGPLPHWWPLLHAAIIVVAVLSRLCHLSGTRPAVGAPAENSDCARLTSDLAAAAVVLNVVPVAIALRALQVWPWRGGAFERLAALSAAPSVRAARCSQNGKPPALVLARRGGLQDPRPILTVQDAIESHGSKSFGCLTDPRTPVDATSVSSRTVTNASLHRCYQYIPPSMHPATSSDISQGLTRHTSVLRTQDLCCGHAV